MTSKPKSKVFVVLEYSTGGKCCGCVGRYLVGARNLKEAEQTAKNVLGKTRRLKGYDNPITGHEHIKYGEVWREFLGSIEVCNKNN